MIRSFLNWNVWLSRAFDRLLPEDYRIDGNSDYLKNFAPRWLKPGIRVVDIGGGKNPYVSAEKKAQLGLHVIGVDISAAELARAPAGAYDRVVCADIALVAGPGDADLCICQALLEHVEDAEGALKSIVSFLKPGGVALVFVPSRNAVFARLNLLLPERVKRFVLFTIYPQARRDQGFQSYYHRCTPKDFSRMAESMGLVVVEQRSYFISAYFTFFAPLHLLWRVWIITFRALAGEQAAETFSMALKKMPWPDTVT